MEELTGEAVYEGLVAHGMLGDKTPPVLTAESFYQHSRDKENRYSSVARMLYRHAMASRDYLTACYALYYAAKYEFEIPVDICQVEKSNDCLLKLFAFLYSQETDDADLHAELMKHAKAIAVDGGDERFDRNWIFLYEALSVNELPPGDWREIKKAGVAFIDREKLNKPDYSEVAAQAELDELLALENDDHGEDDPSEGGANEL